MPALTEIGKFKRLAELFVLAMKIDSMISTEKNSEVIECLLDYGLTRRQAERLINTAFSKLDRGMLRSPEEILRDVSTFFRKTDHGFIVTQIQAILETGAITEKSQQFFDICCKYLYHE